MGRTDENGQAPMDPKPHGKKLPPILNNKVFLVVGIIGIIVASSFLGISAFTPPPTTIYNQTLTQTQAPVTITVTLTNRTTDTVLVPTTTSIVSYSQQYYTIPINQNVTITTGNQTTITITINQIIRLLQVTML